MQRAAVLLSLLTELKTRGNWCGETHIQKTTYFVQELLQVPLGFEFILYKHGPYSFDLSDEITALRADLLLEVHSRAPYGASIFPSERSKAFIERYPQTRRRYAARLGFAAKCLATKNVTDLERLATALYVSREPSAASDLEVRADRIHELKPHIAKQEARQALRFVDEMAQEAESVIRP
jgi:uncharacterized protein YwgA